MPKLFTVWITINRKILKELGIPDHLTCLLRNLYAGQEATVKLNMNQELPDVQAGFRKGRGARDQIANIRWIIKKNKSSRRTSFTLLTTPKPLIVWITANCGKF